MGIGVRWIKIGARWIKIDAGWIKMGVRWIQTGVAAIVTAPSRRRRATFKWLRKVSHRLSSITMMMQFSNSGWSPVQKAARKQRDAGLAAGSALMASPGTPTPTPA